MGSSKKRSQIPQYNRSQISAPKPPVVTFLLDQMEDGREYSSIISCNPVNMDFAAEIKRAINEIAAIRHRPVVCYIANLKNPSIKSSISIDNTDDKPFSEMLSAIPAEAKDVDIILVTPGGSAEKVASWVAKLRNRFENVGFILPYLAMSAGTIFCLSGDEIIMSEDASIGPIDPQVISREGRFVPAQSMITLIDDIKRRGEECLKSGKQPPWTDLQVLKNLDAKELGNAYNASSFSTLLVTEYLEKYKFRTWKIHSSSGKEVTSEEKHTRAVEIAEQLCKHSLWLSHSREISREMAHETCRLEITHPESIEGLDRAIRRFWALICWCLERSTVSKIFISENYSIFKQDVQIQPTSAKK